MLAYVKAEIYFSAAFNSAIVDRILYKNRKSGAMKNYALAAFLTLAAIVSFCPNSGASPYHVDNIVLKSFQAMKVPTGAKVSWEFASEELDVTCTLEKSTDGINFVAFRSFHLASTRQQPLHSFLDKEVLGTTFYRLRITKESYQPYVSIIISLNIQAQTAANNAGQPLAMVSLNNNFFGELSTQNKVMCVRLVDICGQAKMKQYIKGTDLERMFRPSMSNLPAGYYVLNINDAQNKPLLNKYIYKF